MTILMLAIGLIAAVAPLAGRQATAQGEPPRAAVVRGECGELGDVAANLRPLSASEGGVLTSFSTIDLAIGELTGGGYAIVVGAVDAPAACGELVGAGEDVYVAISEQNASGLGGIAWLHARNARTQVSLFMGVGLGTAAGPTPTEDPNKPPEPPVDETPTPTAATGEGTYTSPSYGVTIAFDPAVWRVQTQTTSPGSMGPVDYMALNNTAGVAQVECIAFPMPSPVLAPQYLDNLALGFVQNEKISNVTIRTDAAGNQLKGGDAMHAFIVLNLTATNDIGQESLLTFHAEAWQMPAVEGFVVVIYETLQSRYDQDVALREALFDGVQIPS